MKKKNGYTLEINGEKMKKKWFKKSKNFFAVGKNTKLREFLERRKEEYKRNPCTVFHLLPVLPFSFEKKR